MLPRRLARIARAGLRRVRPGQAGRPPRGGRKPAGRSASPYVRIADADAGSASACVICGADPVDRVAVQKRDDPARRLVLLECPSCGHVANPGNTFDYRGYQSMEEMTPGPRVGTEQQQGREFHMAAMAVEILGREDLDVLVFGAGRSLDNRHIEGLAGVGSVTIADIMQVRDDAPFIKADEPAPRRYDVVVASEVIEHFLDPRADLAHLLSFVDADGLLVCSTNIMNGSDVATQKYPFFRGHVSLYSPGSLGILARENGCHVDFRLPIAATGFAGLHKRYVLLSRSADVMARTAAYFGRHAYAPSDPAHPV